MQAKIFESELKRAESSKRDQTAGRDYELIALTDRLCLTKWNGKLILEVRSPSKFDPKTKDFVWLVMEEGRELVDKTDLYFDALMPIWLKHGEARLGISLDKAKEDYLATLKKKEEVSNG